MPKALNLIQLLAATQAMGRGGAAPVVTPCQGGAVNGESLARILTSEGLNGWDHPETREYWSGLHVLDATVAVTDDDDNRVHEYTGVNGDFYSVEPNINAIFSTQDIATIFDRYAWVIAGGADADAVIAAEKYTYFTHQKTNGKVMRFDSWGHVLPTFERSFITQAAAADDSAYRGPGGRWHVLGKPRLVDWKTDHFKVARMRGAGAGAAGARVVLLLRGVSFNRELLPEVERLLDARDNALVISAAKHGQVGALAHTSTTDAARDILTK